MGYGSSSLRVSRTPFNILDGSLLHEGEQPSGFKYCEKALYGVLAVFVNLPLLWYFA